MIKKAILNKLKTVFNGFKWLINLFWFIIFLLKKPVIKVTDAFLSGDGNFIDVRYWLSKPIQNFSNSVFLLDEHSGFKIELMSIPKYGKLKTRHRKYFQKGVLLFVNYNKIIKVGSAISLFYGNIKVSKITVK